MSRESVLSLIVSSVKLDDVLSDLSNCFFYDNAGSPSFVKEKYFFLSTFEVNVEKSIIAFTVGLTRRISRRRRGSIV